MRHIYYALRLIFVAIGFIGAFLPVLPTTPFLILATACFARSSPRLEHWLLSHPQFGAAALRGWRKHGTIPWKAKLLSLAGTSIGFWLFWIGSKPGPLLMAGVGILMLSGLIYIFSRPSSPSG